MDDRVAHLSHQVKLAKRSITYVLRTYGPNSYRLQDKLAELKITEERLARAQAEAAEAIA